jgi:hypothetical protein
MTTAGTELVLMQDLVLNMHWLPWDDLDDSQQLTGPIWIWSLKPFASCDGEYPLGGYYRVLWHVWPDTKWVFLKLGVTHYMRVPAAPVAVVEKLQSS